MLKKLLFLFAFFPSILLAQHTIKGTFTPAEEYKWIIIYKVTPTTSIYVDNAEVAEDGTFEFNLNESITPGTYRIVYALPQEEFNFDLIYNAKEDVAFTFSSEKGVDFTKSNENKLLTSYTKSMMLVSQTINSFYSKGSKDEKTFNKIFSTLKEAQTSFEEASKGSIAANFIKANAPYIPSSYEDVKTYAKNVKANYLKHSDFNNSTLQSSNFLVERMLSYVFGMSSSPDDVDAFKNNVDTVANALKTTDKKYQETLLEILWNQFVDLENETLANYVATSYLIPVTKENNNQILTEKLTVFKNTSIKAVAPDFSWTVGKDDKKTKQKLSKLDVAERYVIVFWSSSCSHCLEELPELRKLVKATKKGELKVIAIGLEDEPYNWNNETAYYPDFIHIYGKGKWENTIGDAYGVTATPTYYLLNKDKKIINKPYDFPALKKYLDKNPIKKAEPKKESEKDEAKKEG